MGDAKANPRFCVAKNIKFKAETLTFKAPLVRFKGLIADAGGRSGGGGGYDAGDICIHLPNHLNVKTGLNQTKKRSHVESRRVFYDWLAKSDQD